MDDAKPQTEVTEESRETLSVLELDRTPRPQKLALERAYFDGAHEVRFTERTFRPRHGAALDEIRSFVDSLEIRRRERLNAPAGASGSSASPAVPPLPAPPQVVPVHAAPRIPDHYRGPLERVIAGALVSVETVHRVGSGTVVDVAWESRDEGERRGLYIIENDEARPYTAVADAIDSLPAPMAPGPSPSPSPSPSPAPAKEEKKRFGFGKKKDAPAPAAEPAPGPAEEPKKRRFGFGKK